MDEKKFYHIFPPGVDAYLHSHLSPTTDISFNEFKKKMVRHALEWGEQAVGRFVIGHYEPPKVLGKIVLVCGYWGDIKFVGLTPSRRKMNKSLGVWKWYEVDILQHDFPDEWDAT